MKEDSPDPEGSAPRPGVAVAVVVPCHDDGGYLREAVDSIPTADSPATEVIVVDDGSTDPRTRSVLARLERDGGLRVLRRPHEGLCAARNAGIEATTAPYILPLDADNRLRPGYIARAAQVLDRDPEVGVVYADARRFGRERAIWRLPDFDASRLLVENFIDACSVFRRRVWEDCGGYDGARFGPGYEDWDLWVSAYERGWRFHHLGEVLFDYRVRENSMLARLRNQRQRRELMRRLIEKHRRTYEAAWPELLLDLDGRVRELELLVRRPLARLAHAVVEGRRGPRRA